MVTNRALGIGAGLMVAALMIGCRSSTTRFEAAGEIVETERPIPFASEGRAIGALFSPDGGMVGILEGSPDGERFEFAVRDRASGDEKLRYRLDGDRDWFPALFSADGRAVYFVGSFEDRVVARRIALDGRVHETPAGEPRPDGALVRLDGSAFVALVNDTILTNDGKLVPLGAKVAEVAYDADGRLWAKAGGWRRIEPSGKAVAGSAPRERLAEPGQRRSGLRLVSQDATLEFRGASAYGTAIWLTEDRELPDKGRPDDPRATLAYFGPDVRAFAFVPGRDQAYVVTDAGSFIVPFHRTRNAP